MIINGREVTHEVRLPVWMQLYLNDRGEALERTIQKRIDKLKIQDEINVYYNQSRLSEAMYFTIQNEDTGDAHTITIRNHNIYCSESSSDTVIYMSDFENWSEIKRYVMYTVLREIGL